MLERIGRKFVSGAKAEMQENPTPLIDTTNLTETVENLLTLGILAITIFGLGKKAPQPVTVVVNNYITKATGLN